jgi:hypothetical protein
MPPRLKTAEPVEAIEVVTPSEDIEILEAEEVSDSEENAAEGFCYVVIKRLQVTTNILAVFQSLESLANAYPALEAYPHIDADQNGNGYQAIKFPLQP